eukprot:515432_1
MFICLLHIGSIMCAFYTLNADTLLTQENKIDLLMHLNILRSNTAKGSIPTASNMNFVFWDESLAMISHDAANRCEMNQAPSYRNFLQYQAKYSEWQYPSIGGLVSYSAISTQRDRNISSLLISLLDSAFDPNQNYTYSKYLKNDTDHQMFHFLAWSQLRYFGCGYQDCPLIGILFYCTLFYTNDIVNDYPWIAGKPCTQCPVDKSKCWNGLCAYCMSSDYYIHNPPQYSGDVCINLGIDYSNNDNKVNSIMTKALVNGKTIVIGIIVSIMCILCVFCMHTKANQQNEKQQIEDDLHFDYHML